MDESTRVAFEFAFKSTEHLITIATGIIALSITFLKDFVGGVESRTGRRLALLAWFLFLISVSCGLLTFLQLTGNIGNPVIAEPSIYTPSIRLFSIAQVAFFLLGLVLAVAFAILAARPMRDRDAAGGAAPADPPPQPKNG